MTLHDVMQFDVHVIVKAADVMRFMQELCSAKTHKFRGWLGDQPEQTYKHNQISILESQIAPVDREDFDHSSYQYGNDEVVDVDLICEYVCDSRRPTPRSCRRRSRTTSPPRRRPPRRPAGRSRGNEVAGN